MKKIFMNFAALLLLVGLSACATTNTGIVERARRDLNPGVGGAKFDIKMASVSDEKEPYLIRFVIEFDRPTKANAFWEHEGSRKLIKDGIMIYPLDEDGYVQLFTLDMRAVKSETGSFGTPIAVHLGYNNPISGCPTYDKVLVHQNKNLPAEERNKCFEATCLEIVGLKWNTEKQAYDEKWVVFD